VKAGFHSVNPISGVLVVDKPPEWTSHDVVNRVRRITGIRRVGHLGTLDPMATGVLPVVVGKATRLAQFFERGDKVYDATVRFGYATDTYDIDGTPTTSELDVKLDRDDITRRLPTFEGRILQTPPPVSAKKIGGVPAYKLARQNIPVVLEPVEVQVYGIELLRCEDAEIDIRVHCAAGTYVRSIAHDLGNQIGCGAHLKNLRRIVSSGFDVTAARTLDQLAAMAEAGNLEEALIPAAALLPQFPAELVDTSTANFIRQGRDFRVSPFRKDASSRYVKAVTKEGELIAIGEAKLPNLYHPILVF
jgi:tRNA pseudouridine55 synthase